MSRPLVVLVQCFIAVAVVGNLCVLGYWVRNQIIAAQKKGQGEDRKPESESKAFVIKMNEITAESFGVAVEPAREGVWRERILVFGRVVPNPNATYEVRSPFPGTLQASGSSWPTPGLAVQPKQALAYVTVRVAPDARLELLARFRGAELKK